jgi:hypothetical protein
MADHPGSHDNGTEKKGGSTKIDRKSIPVGPFKTANWPGNPGPKGKDRGLGLPKIKQGMLEDY